MNRYISNILKCIACLISWLTISPLFYYLTRKWGIMKKWISILLLCISPLFIYIYFFIIACIYVGHIKYQLKHKFDDKAIVENIIGVPLPDYDITNREMGKISFNGDYEVELEIEFKELPSIHFFETLDSLATLKESDWNRKKDHYLYSKMWGNGIAVPNGVDDKEDMTFSIYIIKGNKQATINYGAW